MNRTQALIRRTSHLLLLLTACLAVSTSPVCAQTPQEWTEPVYLSQNILDPTGDPASSISVSLAADPWTRVHAFWVSEIESSTSSGYSMYYSMWDGASWTEPVDIFYGAGYWDRPQVAIDSKGWLHLTWIGGGQAWYSNAFAPDAGSLQAWQAPRTVTDDSASSIAIVAGPSGTLHAIYCSSGRYGQLAYTSSGDGETWSSPVRLAEVRGCWARVAADGRERLHVVYADQEGVSSGIAAYYIASEDGGQTWSNLLELDRQDERFVGEYGPAWANVLAVGNDEVHVVWDGAPAGERWHQWSRDGGKTWTSRQQILDGLRGLTQPNALGADGAGRVHLISLGWPGGNTNRQGPFHAVWDGSTWSPLRQIGTRENWDAEGPALAIAGGNKLVAAWWNRSGEPAEWPVEVWTSTLAITAPEITSQPLPTPTRASNAEETAPHIVPEAISNTSPFSTAITTTPGAALPGTGAGSVQNAIVIGILPALLLVAGILVIQLRQRKR